MKALIVADNQLVIENISTVLKAAGYDTIVYKWLLKALDNIEEIGPHLIVISTEEYPRHWKTLTQFSQTNFGDYAPQVILYTGQTFDKEEQSKAQALGVRGTFESVDVEGLDKLREILKTKIDIYSGKLTEPHIESASITQKSAENNTSLQDFEQKNYIPCSFIFTNPITGAIVSGYAKNYDGSTLEYFTDSEDSIVMFEKDLDIPCATIKIDSEYKEVKARVMDFTESGLLLEIKKSA